MKNTWLTWAIAASRGFAGRFCLLLPLLLTACAGVAPVVKVGLVGPFEGKFRGVGYDVIYSARLAVRQVNRAGGIDGVRVTLVAFDDGGDPELATSAASALAIDPAVVAVVGHWLPETSAAAAPIYKEADLAYIMGGEAPYAASDQASLSPEFQAAYEAVTPFDEAPGPYAGAAYEAFQRLWKTLAVAAESGSIDRESVYEAFAESSEG